MAATLILNVDDVAAHRYTKSRILTHANYEVVEAGTGAEALRLVHELRPNLVLLDVNLPDMNGLDVCRAIRATRLGSRIPILHITATSIGDEYETASIEHGADVYLAEPVEPHTLLTIVGVLLRLRKTEAVLADSEERMRLATEAAGIGTWEVDLDTGIGVWSKELYRMLGYAPDMNRPTWGAWQARIHPDDRQRVTDALRHARASGTEFREQHRIIRANDGAERSIAPFGRIYADERGEPTRFLGVLTDVTARARAAAEREHLLEQANLARAEAERASRLKDEFLASLSHELRTPMHAMLGWMQLIRSGSLSEQQRSQALGTIERNARLQNQLINELLDISRVTSGKLQVQFGNVAMGEVLAAALESVRPTAEAKQIELTHTLDPALQTITADADRLQQVLGNLLSNAVKFTPAGGRVQVECRLRNGAAEIEVIDNGEGIAQEALPHIFEAFRQADGSITRRHGGLGLGLAIVQRLVSLHGGSVRAESAGPDRGARFVVTLPLSGPSAAPVESTPATRAPVATGSSRLQGVTVVAVDDNADMLHLMREMLRWEGASVRTATSAATALRLAREAPPDVFILDIGMPDMHGYALLQALRREAAGSERVPAIAVTGYASLDDAARAMAAGFQAHLAKPFDMEELFTLVETLAAQPRN